MIEINFDQPSLARKNPELWDELSGTIKNIKPGFTEEGISGFPTFLRLSSQKYSYIYGKIKNLPLLSEEDLDIPAFLRKNNPAG